MRGLVNAGPSRPLVDTLRPGCARLPWTASRCSVSSKTIVWPVWSTARYKTAIHLTEAYTLFTALRLPQYVARTAQLASALGVVLRGGEP